MKQAVLDSKVALVNEIKEKFTNSQSSVVVEYRGLTVAEVTELRRALRAEGVEFKVYKNSMSQRAAEAAGFNGLVDQLTGPNAIAFSDDAVAPSRVLAKFAKTHEKLVLKAGIVEGKEVSLDTIKELASLPGREGLLSMLLSCLKAPIRKVACVTKAVAEAKESGASAPETKEVVEEAAVAAVAEAAPSGPTEVSVILKDAGASKVGVIKVVREITGLGLVEAKGLVDKAPSPIKENIKPEEAEEIKKKLMDAGASVEIK